MSFNKACYRCSNILFYQTNCFRIPNNTITSVAKTKSKPETIISGRRAENDHYIGKEYKKFEEVPLISKGWNHSKSVGDYFVVHPNPETYVNLPNTELNEIDIHSDLVAALHQQNITKLTSFQKQSFDVILHGKHAVLTAETGSGKTLAYTLPIVQSLIGNKVMEMNTPRALILTPSRELAYQVSSVIKPLAEAVNLNVSVIVGGRVKLFMLNPEFKEIDVLVGTPGVVGKLSTVGIFRLNKVVSTVLDEADTLLDDSFTDRIPTLIKRVSQSHLTLVSATIPRNVPEILEPYESHFIHVTSPLVHKPSSNISQRFLRLLRSAKPPHILEIAKNNKGPLIIFTNRSDTCNWLGIFFGNSGVKYARINGKMKYNDRVEEWNKFVTGMVDILISTDIGSRGLDTTHVKHIVNYDFPIYAADYLHRIGRTGRFGSPDHCKVTNFISGPEEVRLVQQIELAVRKNEPLPHVDGNITKILQNKIRKDVRETDTA